MNIDNLKVTFVDDYTNLPVILSVESIKDWKNKRQYFELYQSDRRTRVISFSRIDTPPVLKNAPILNIGNHMYSYTLSKNEGKYPKTKNLVAALNELANLISKNIA